MTPHRYDDLQGAKVRRSPSVLLAVLLALVLIAMGCSWLASEPSKLKIAITGLPEGVSGAVTVMGPDGDSYELAGNDDREVEPGEYVISAAPVSASGSTYYTDFDDVTVAVGPKQTTAFEVDYEIEIPESTKVITEPPGGGASIRVDGDRLVMPIDVASKDIGVGKYIVAIGADVASGIVVKRVRRVEWGVDTLTIEGADVPLIEAIPKGVIKLGGEELVPRSRIVPASYDSALPLTSAVRQSDEGPLFEIGFGGAQTGITSNAADKNYPDVKNVRACSAEIPPTKFSLDDFAIVPDGEISWDAHEGAYRATIKLDVQGAYTITAKAPIEVKCSIEAHLKDIYLDKLCKLPRAWRIVRLGPIRPDCEVTGAIKANLHLTKSGQKHQLKGAFTYGATASLTSSFKADGKTVSNSHETMDTTEDGGLKFSVDMAAEVEIGGKLLELIGAAFAVELGFTVEESQEEIKVPFKGKIFVKFSGIELSGVQTPHEVQLFHWSVDLFYLKKDSEEGTVPSSAPSPKPSPSPSKALIKILYGEHDDPETIQAVIDEFIEHEGEEVFILIEAEFGESFDVWPADTGPVSMSGDTLEFTPQGCVSESCPVLYILLPEGVPAIDEYTGATGVEFSFAGEFVINAIEKYDEEETLLNHFYPHAYWVYLSEAQ